MKICPDCNGDGVIEKGTDEQQRCNFAVGVAAILATKKCVMTVLSRHTAARADVAKTLHEMESAAVAPKPETEDHRARSAGGCTMRVKQARQAQQLPQISFGVDLSRALDPCVMARDCGIKADPAQAKLLTTTARKAILCTRQRVQKFNFSLKALHPAPALVILMSPSQQQSRELYRNGSKLP
jgi:hypothetical protein